jgi:hypothetical protein
VLRIQVTNTLMNALVQLYYGVSKEKEAQRVDNVTVELRRFLVTAVFPFIW